MSAGTIQPALDAILGHSDGRTDSVLGGTAVCIGRCARDITLPFEALAELVIRPSDMLAEDVAAGVLVLGEVARGAGRVGLDPGICGRGRRSSGRVGGLAADEPAQPQNQNLEESCHRSVSSLTGLRP